MNTPEYRLPDIVQYRSTGRNYRQSAEVARTRADRERTDFGVRMERSRKAAGLTQVQVREAVGIGQTTLSDLEGHAERSGFTAQLARLYGVDAAWLATGEGKAPPWWHGASASPGLDAAQSLGQGDARNSAARLMSDPPMHDAPLISWGEAMRATDLPELFWLELPDDSMAPRARAGKRMGFSRTEPVKVGAGILARDPAGVLYFRRYIAAPAGQWIAHAENPDYADMHSERDGLQLVAVLIAEWGGWH